MQRLTAEQQKLVKNSLWVVNTVMKAQNLEGNKDIRQQALLYMCKCAMRFDPTRGVKWETYAYKSANLYIKRIVAKERQKHSCIESIEELTHAESDLFGYIEPEIENNAKYIVDTLKSRCSPEELQILTMTECGYKGYEISRELKCSASTLKMRMDSIREKAREIILS